MNKASKNNVFEPKMISELYRHLESYKLNENIKIVYLDNNNYIKDNNE